jgi:glycosyltransferase involved in cell wall biosynthesis
MKRILFIPGVVKETIGGAELQASYIAEALGKEGFDIYGIHIHQNYFTTPKYAGYSFNRSRWVQRVDANIFYAKKIYDLIKRIKPDVIYSRAFMPYSLLPAVYYSRKSPCKSIWHISHNNRVKKFHINSFKHLPFEIIDHFALKDSIRYVDCIISQTHHQAMLLQKNYNRQVNQVIPNFHPKPEARIQKGIPPQVVWVANFKTWKQPELFISLASELRNYKEVKFIMIGRSVNNQWMEKIKQQMKTIPNLTWLGSLPIEKVNEILAQSHIFVNTSRSEGFPNTFIQAWMRKVPVLSLSVDIDGILEKEEVGFICHTFENLVERTKLLIENQSRRDEMGMAAQRYAFENFLIEANMPEVLSAFTG